MRVTRPARRDVLGPRSHRSVPRARRVELRQHPHPAAPPGLGPRAHPRRRPSPTLRAGGPPSRFARVRQRLLVERPGVDTPHARRAHRAQRAGVRLPGAQRLRAGRLSRRAGPAAGEPGRHQFAEVAQQPGPLAVGQLQHVPRRARTGPQGRAGQRRRHTVGEGEVHRPGARLQQIPLARLRHPRCRQIADVAVGPAQDHRARLGPVGAVDPGEVEGGALRAVLGLGVPGDAQTVVEEHYARGVDRPRVQQLGRSGRAAGQGAGRRRHLDPLAWAGPDGQGAAQQGPVAGEVAAGRPHGEVDARRALPRGGIDPGQLRRVEGGLGGRIPRVRGCGGAVGTPALAGQTEQCPAHQQRRPGGERGLQVLAAPHQVGGAGLERAGIELGGVEQPVLRGDPVGLQQRAVRVGDTRRRERLAHPVVRESLQAAQRVRGPGRSRQGGQPLVQGEFVGAAGPREQLQAPHLRQQRRKLGPLGPCPAPQWQPRLQRRAQHLEADQGVARVAVTPGRLGRDHRCRCAVAGECALGEGVCGHYAPAAAQARWQHQVGEPHEPRVVLDERGLGLLDVDDRSGGGGGCGALGDIL